MLVNTVPILLASGHLPSLASGSPHCVTEGIFAISPAGSVELIFFRYCWPSSRVRLSVKLVVEPPAGGLASVVCARANGVDVHATSNDVTGVRAAVPVVNGVSAAVAAA